MSNPHIGKLDPQDNDPQGQVTITGGWLGNAAEAQWDGSTGTGSLQLSSTGEQTDPDEDTGTTPEE